MTYTERRLIEVASFRVIDAQTNALRSLLDNGMLKRALTAPADEKIVMEAFRNIKNLADLYTVRQLHSPSQQCLISLSQLDVTTRTSVLSEETQKVCSHTHTHTHSTRILPCGFLTV